LTALMCALEIDLVQVLVGFSFLSSPHLSSHLPLSMVRHGELRVAIEVLLAKQDIRNAFIPWGFATLKELNCGIRWIRPPAICRWHLSQA
jgi:hypothetical protein